MPSKTVGVTLNNNTYYKAAEYAQAKNIPVSYVIRHALELYITELEQQGFDENDRKRTESSQPRNRFINVRIDKDYFYNTVQYHLNKHKLKITEITQIALDKYIHDYVTVSDVMEEVQKTLEKTAKRTGRSYASIANEIVAYLEKIEK